MSNVKISDGVVHQLPDDFKKAINSSPKVFKLWEDITPLARNEWICWVEQARQAKTRERRIRAGLSKMSGGMRRPCCWAGCMHRTDKALSPSQEWVLGRQAKN